MPRLENRGNGGDVSCALGTVQSTSYYTKLDKSYEVAIRISISQMEAQEEHDCPNITQHHLD